MQPGSRLGPYEIVARLGAGGMGEVYRARDARLGREVAVKVLPPEFASDSDRRQRFEQEARAASALNHPGIVSVYDVGSSEGNFFIAMELVEGQTLRDLLGAGEPMPLRGMLDTAAQVAEGLAKAHAAGIVHRDLKPENVMVSADGFVKVLDFGLAKLAEAPTQGGSHLPTVSPGTTPGIVLGTVGYMSPEQASGKPVDFRSDQFSLGSILYEMASGQRAFDRPTAAEALTAIIREEPPPLSRVNPAPPPPVRWIVERCLAKDPKDRYASTLDLARDLRSVRDHLSEIAGSGPSEAVKMSPPRRFGRIAAGVALLLAGALGGAFAARRFSAPAVARVAPLLKPLTFSGRDFSPAVSPDGKTIVFVSEREGKGRIWLKQLSDGAEAALTEGPDNFPRFSPDGSAILFIRGGENQTAVYRQGLVGGEARKIVENGAVADWSPDGRQIVFLRQGFTETASQTSAHLVSSDGSGLRTIAAFSNRRVSFPRFSPDGRRVAFSELAAGGAPSSIIVVPLDGKEPRFILTRNPAGRISAVAWLADGRSVVYGQALSASGAVTGTDAQIVVQDLDSGASEIVLQAPLSGQTVEILGDGRLVIDTTSARENLREILLAKGPAAAPRWLTRGQSNDRQPVYSPDGDWILFSSNRSGNLDLWEISRKSGAVRRITDDTAEDWDPGFTSDGKILWSSNRSGPYEVWMANSDGGNARQVTHDGVDAENPTATPDGRWIAYASGDPAKLGIWKIHPDGTGAVRLAEGTLQVPEISPDGRWIAFVDSGRAQIRIVSIENGAQGSAPIPVVGFRQTANQSGVLGRSRWMPDGKALAFLGRDESGVNGLYVQDVVPGTDTSGMRRRLGGFDSDVISESFGISRDGTRLTIAAFEPVFGIMLGEHIPKVTRPTRRSP